MATSPAPPARADSGLRRRSLLQALSHTASLLGPGQRVNGMPRRTSRPSMNADRIKFRGRRETTQEQDEGADVTPRPAIFNDEIEQLRIRLEDLEKLSTSRAEPPKEEEEETVWRRVVVRRTIPPEERRPRMKSVLVLRKAPPDAPTQIPNPLDRPGPRFDRAGHLVPHSILGTVEEYYRMDQQRSSPQHSWRLHSNGSAASFCSTPLPCDHEARPWGRPPADPAPGRPRVGSAAPRRRVRWHDGAPHSAPVAPPRQPSADSLPYWTPRDSQLHAGLPIRGCTRLPSSALVSALRPSRCARVRLP